MCVIRGVTGTTIQKPPCAEVFDPTVSRMVKTKSATLPRIGGSSPPVGVGGLAMPEVVTKVQYKSMSMFVIVLLLLLIGLNVFLYVKLWELEKLEAHKFQYPDFTKLRYVRVATSVASVASVAECLAWFCCIFYAQFVYSFVLFSSPFIFWFVIISCSRSFSLSVSLLIPPICISII